MDRGYAFGSAHTNLHTDVRSINGSLLASTLPFWSLSILLTGSFGASPLQSTLGSTSSYGARRWPYTPPVKTSQAFSQYVRCSVSSKQSANLPFSSYPVCVQAFRASRNGHVLVHDERRSADCWWSIGVLLQSHYFRTSQVVPSTLHHLRRHQHRLGSLCLYLDVRFARAG